MISTIDKLTIFGYDIGKFKETEILMYFGDDMKENRRRQLEKLIAERKSISMQELCQCLNVSINTVRADVNALVRDGLVEKVYGGIIFKEQEEIPLYERRNLQRTDCKCAIAQAAEGLIEDGDIIYLDAGTTVMRVLDYLQPEKHITVVTASISVMMRAQTMENVTMVFLPGLYDKRTNAVLDSSTVDYLMRFQHTKAFFGVSTITNDGLLGVSNWQEYELKRTALAHSRCSFLLLDATKYGRTALLSYGRVDQMTGVVTDKEMPAAFRALCEKHGVFVKLV